jgi:heterodisulfide reductase subunit A-like polyferredoxin
METIFCKCGHSIKCHEHSGGCVITDERGYYACGCSLSPEQIAVEHTAARIAELEAALAKLEYVFHPYVSAANKRRCPVCGTPEGRGHEFDTDCWLGTLLAKGK